ncbi:prephenate dehydrogenase [Stomatohabitans albus]|uniref:prephenate dehydrogenase n=1 Tax=Stomatohabitans albus TaxID=3110766 RepID=UPI00300D523B
MDVAIIGTGLIGASLGLALHTIAPIDRIVGWDSNDDDEHQALHSGAIDATITPSQIGEVDLVVLAVPPSAIAAVMSEIGPYLRPGMIVTDIASVKRDVVATMVAYVPEGVDVIGGHPMAGSHERGAKAALPDLFVAATWLLTPTETTTHATIEIMRNLIEGLGARVVIVSPHEHDRLVAIVSHLPQMAASTLMTLAADRAKRQHAQLLLLAAGGFRDATRVAASDADLWLDIAFANKQAIMEVLDEFGARLGQIRMLLHDDDVDGMRTFLSGAREARRSLPGKASHTGQWVELRIVLPDQPGSLAEITRIMGELGINIEDFGITHAPEGGRGRMRLTVSCAEDARRGAEALKACGYSVFERNL